MAQENQSITRNRRIVNTTPNNRFERRVVRDIHGEFRKSFENIGHDPEEIIEELDSIEDLKEIASIEIEKLSFPMLLFLIALFFDLFDLIEFSGIGYFVTLIVKIIFTIYLFFWMSGKLGTIFRSASKLLFKSRIGKAILIKSARKFLTRRLALIFVFNIIPILGILASNAFFVFLAHNHMNKIAQTYINFIEETAGKIKAYQRTLRG